MAGPGDFALAGGGDIAALRRLRDDRLELAMGLTENIHHPRYDALAQLELLSELAAGIGQAEDQVFLIAAYQLRIAALEHSLAAIRDCRAQATAADGEASAHWHQAESVCAERLQHYRERKDALLAAALAITETGALLVSGLTTQADGGDERAAVLLQSVIGSMTAEHAKAIQAKVKKNTEEAGR